MPPAATRAPGRGRLRADPEAGEYFFELGEMAYRISVGPSSAPSPLLRIDAATVRGEWCCVCDEAGMLLRLPNGAVLSPVQAAERLQMEELRPAVRGKTLLLRYAERLGEATLRRTVQLRLVGQSLVIQVSAAAAPPVSAAAERAESRNGRGRGRRGRSPRINLLPDPDTEKADESAAYAGFTFGTIGGTAAREVLVPYTIDPVYLLENGWFVSAYVDRFLSSADACPRGTAFYRCDRLGVTLPVTETLYVTAAAEPLEALPLLETRPSPYRGELARRLVLDVWSDAPFTTDQETFARLRRYGMADILVHYNTWQQHGFGRRLPAHYPANPERGSNEEFRQLIRAAQDQGWLVALREDYTAVSPESSYWDAAVVARTADGAPRPARLDGHAVAADCMLPFARLESTKVERNYLPGAASIGCGAAYNPEDQLHQIDLSGRAGSRTITAAIQHGQALCRYLRDLHQGPLIGEGGEGPGRFDTFYAGVVDSFERPLEGRAGGPVIPDFELHRVQPVMAGHGVGFYGRFFNEIHGQAPIDPARVSWDLYRATEIAFAHAGFLSTAQVPPPALGPWTPMGSMREAFTEYFLMRGVQERLMTTPVRRIAYHHAGQFLDLAAALRAGMDLSQAQLRIEYERGLTVFVNRHARQEWTVRWEGMHYALPPSGWLVGEGRDFLAYSALIAGNRADAVRSPEYLFLNVRSDVARRIERITSDGAVALVQSTVPGRRDLFACGCKIVSEDVELLKLSERGDVSLIHRSEQEVEVCVLDSESGGSVSVTVPLFGPEWDQERVPAAGKVDDTKGHLLLEELESGEWRRASSQVQHTRRGLQLVRLRPDVVYRLRAEG
jgi:hypothetical protein